MNYGRELASLRIQGGVMTQRIESGTCPVSGTERPLRFLGSTETISDYIIDVFECQVCDAVVHVPRSDSAPFNRHRETECPIGCLDM